MWPEISEDRKFFEVHLRFRVQSPWKCVILWLKSSHFGTFKPCADTKLGSWRLFSYLRSVYTSGHLKNVFKYEEIFRNRFSILSAQILVLYKGFIDTLLLIFIIPVKDGNIGLRSRCIKFLSSYSEFSSSKFNLNTWSKISCSSRATKNSIWVKKRWKWMNYFRISLTTCKVYGINSAINLKFGSKYLSAVTISQA